MLYRESQGMHTGEGIMDVRALLTGSTRLSGLHRFRRLVAALCHSAYVDVLPHPASPARCKSDPIATRPASVVGLRTNPVMPA